jgi:glycosyltransferase involved in cell wall biosynthesis
VSCKLDRGVLVQYLGMSQKVAESLPVVVSFVFNEFTNDIRVLKQNRSLAQSGFHPRLMATQAKGLPDFEEREGIKIERVWTGPLSVLPLQLLFFWITCFWRCRRETLLHCNDLYALPIGAVIKIFNRRAKVVYDCHEHETEAHVYAGKPLLKWIAKVFERLFIRFADRVICVSLPIAKSYSQMYRIPQPELVLNCPDLKIEKRQNLFREKFGIASDKRIVLFQGEYRKGRGIELLIEGFRQFKDPRVVCVFIGYGPETAMVEQAAREESNIFVHPTVPSGIHMDYVRSADFGIHLMENTCLNHYYALPNKLFEYAMAGIPVIVSNMLEMARLTKENGIGFVLDRNEPQSLVKVLSEVVTIDPRDFESAVDGFRKRYNWQIEEKKFLSIYRDLSQINVPEVSL